jgi:hypothetical protein
MLRACEGVVQVFEQAADDLWPGFDLTRRPFLVYRTGRWALLVAAKEAPEGFVAPPASWPPLGRPRWLLPGGREGWIGQLVFDVQVGDARAVAVGLPEQKPQIPGVEELSYEAVALGFVVHESFHQYQHERFGEIPWGREERYPILDGENGALAALEMRVLADALRAMRAGDEEGWTRAARAFVAVRETRWKRASDLVVRFERGLELQEGTAKYVEVVAVATAGRVAGESRVEPGRSARECFGEHDAAGLVLADLQGRLTGGVLSPDDVARNRIYPVGATLCLLLDRLDPGWRRDAERAGAEFSLFGMVEDSLRAAGEGGDARFEEVAAEHDLAGLRAATEDSLRRWLAAFEAALAAFEEQEGTRVAIELPSRALKRSRASTERRWVLDEGRRSLCPHYSAYTLDRDGLALAIRDRGVYEEDDWDGGRKRLVAFAAERPEVRIDGEPVTLEEGRTRSFAALELTGGGISLRCSLGGSLTLVPGGLEVRLGDDGG